MADNKKSQYRKTFKTMEQNVKNFADQLHDVPPEPRLFSDFNVEVFWTDIVKIGSKLSFEANKISIAWINPPVPTNQDMVTMGGSLELACVAMLGAFHSFPSDGGTQVRASLKEAVGNIFEALLMFLATLFETVGRKYPPSSHPLVNKFALLMNSCDLIAKLPKSNKESCLKILKDNHGVLKDALEELQEAKSDGFMDEMHMDETLNEDDLKIFNPSLGLIKASTGFVKKTMDSIQKFGLEDSSVNLLEYDKAIEEFIKLSPAVDDLALSLYPPLNWGECKECNEVLKLRIEDCLSCIKSMHFVKDPEAVKWNDFVGKAATHNFSEIQRVFISRGLAEMKLTDC